MLYSRTVNLFVVSPCCYYFTFYINNWNLWTQCSSAHCSQCVCMTAWTEEGAWSSRGGEGCTAGKAISKGLVVRNCMLRAFRNVSLFMYSKRIEKGCRPFDECKQKLRFLITIQTPVRFSAQNMNHYLVSYWQICITTPLIPFTQWPRAQTHNTCNRRRHSWCLSSIMHT